MTLALDHLIQRGLGEKLKGGQFDFGFEDFQDLDNGGKGFDPQDHHGCVSLRPCQLQRRLTNEAKGAFGSDKKMPEIIAGIVFQKALIEIQNIAGASDHL